jgi:hypothetical protein
MLRVPGAHRSSSIRVIVAPPYAYVDPVNHCPCWARFIDCPAWLEDRRATGAKYRSRLERAGGQQTGGRPVRSRLSGAANATEDGAQCSPDGRVGGGVRRRGFAARAVHRLRNPGRVVARACGARRRRGAGETGAGQHIERNRRQLSARGDGVRRERRRRRGHLPPAGRCGVWKLPGERSAAGQTDLQTGV